jgi:soluble lytic murein transglycosylase-like protein
MTNVTALLIFLNFIKPVFAGLVSRLLRLSILSTMVTGIFWAQTGATPPSAPQKKAPAAQKGVTPPSADQTKVVTPPAAQAEAKSASDTQTKPSDAPAEPAPAEQQSAIRSAMEESIARQKASVAKQVGGAAPRNSFFDFGWSGPPMITPPPAPIACNAMEAAEAEPLIAAAATAHEIDPAVVRALIRQESGFYPCAVSPKGAMGMMQLMPETAARYNVADPFDPEHNINGGVQYLKDLLGRYKGELKLALAAYNAGPKRVDGEPPRVPEIPETQNYVKRILGELDRTQANQTTSDL